MGLERMLRIHFLQNWPNLSDRGVEEALVRRGIHAALHPIDLGNEPVPDETTICKFRHLLKIHALGEKLFEAVNLHLASLGLSLPEGTIVDATIIHAPSSTKNREKKRDPEMHSTKHKKLTEEEKEKNRLLSKVRARVEHVFRIVKCVSEFSKVRCKSLAKNTGVVYVLFALCNLCMARGFLLFTRGSLSKDRDWA